MRRIRNWIAKPVEEFVDECMYYTSTKSMRNTVYDNPENKDFSDQICSRFKHVAFSNIDDICRKIRHLEDSKANHFIDAFTMIANHEQEMKIFNAFENGNLVICQPVSQPDSGELIPNFYEMDSFVVQKLLDCSSFELPRIDVTEFARGCASNIREVQDYVDSLSARSPGHYTPFVPGNYIVRVQESTDWWLFNNLIHVGKWGQEHSEQSYFSEMNLKKKGMVVSPTTDYQKSYYGENRASFIPYSTLTSGKCWITGDPSKEKVEFINSMIQYEEENESFFFFELLLVNYL